MTLDVVHSSQSGTPAEPPAAGATFYYDLADPDGYLIAERIRGELPVACDWVPVHGASLGLGTSAATPGPDVDALLERMRGEHLLPLRLPDRWPPDSELAMRVATFAKGAGKSIAFSLAAYRQAFAGGRDLADEATVLLAAAACEMHPTAVLKGASLKSTAAALRRAGEQARAAGVSALPAIQVGGSAPGGADPSGSVPGGEASRGASPDGPGDNGTIHCGPAALDDAIAELAGR